MIDRGFVRIAAGLIHYRRAGASAGALPLIMAHAGPGSSAGLVPLIAELSADRAVIAPDMMGNGESDPPPTATTEISFYADCLIAVMNRKGIARADFYGSHTGAQVVAELAIAHPDRVGCLVLDGIALFPDAMRREFLAQYAKPVVPRDDGSHLAWVWSFIRNLTLFFPYYNEDTQHAIPSGKVMPPELLTAKAAELLKVWSTYHIAYGAAFRHAVRARLPLIASPTLVLETERDPLAKYAARAAALIPGAQTALTNHAGKGAAMLDFLRANPVTAN